MTIQYMENFQSYGPETYISTGNVDALLQGLPWAQAYGGLVTDPDVNASGYVWQLGIGSVYGDNRIALPSVTDKVGVAFRRYIANLPTSDSHRCVLASFRDAANLELYGFVIETNGAISLYKEQALGGYSFASKLDTTTNPVMAPQSWFHYEIFLDLNAGEYEVRIEGVPVMSGTGLTLLENIYSVNFGVRTGTGNTPTDSYMKDFVLWDGSGTDNNDFVGPVSVFTLRPNGDVSSGWTRSAEDFDYKVLDDITPDDTNYISADDTPPAASIVELTNLSDEIVGIRGLQMMVRARKSDGGDAVLQLSMLSDGSEDLGATHSITTAYKYWFDVSELDPGTGAAWDPIAVNEATFKINRTT